MLYTDTGQKRMIILFLYTVFFHKIFLWIIYIFHIFIQAGTLTDADNAKPIDYSLYGEDFIRKYQNLVREQDRTNKYHLTY